MPSHDSQPDRAAGAARPPSNKKMKRREKERARQRLLDQAATGADRSPVAMPAESVNNDDSDNDDTHLASVSANYVAAAASEAHKGGKKAKKKRRQTVVDSLVGAFSEPAKGISRDRIWMDNNEEERERIKQFWLGLSDKERKSLVKVEKDAVLRKMKEQQKHTCSCSVCGRKRVAIEEELEGLYDAYYKELEQYASHDATPFFPPRRAPPRPSQRPSIALRGPQDDDGLIADADGGQQPIDDAGFASDEAVLGNYDYDDDVAYEAQLTTADSDVADFLAFGSSLRVKGGILTVADDLLKNDGKRFIEMMENLASRRMRAEETTDPTVGYPTAGHYINPNGAGTAYAQPPPHDRVPPPPPPPEDEYDEEEEADESEAEDEGDYEGEEDEGEEEYVAEEDLTDEQRMEEGRRMFQIFAARMFEQRVLSAYKERVAHERQAKLIEELEEEDRASKELEAKRAKEAQKKKEKAAQRKKAAAEDRVRREEARAAEEQMAKEKEELNRAEEARKREEKRRLREEAQRREEAAKLEREAARLQRKREQEKEQERKAQQAREAKEAKELTERDRKLQEKRDLEKKTEEARLKEQREAKEAEDAKARQKEVEETRARQRKAAEEARSEKRAADDAKGAKERKESEERARQTEQQRRLERETTLRAEQEARDQAAREKKAKELEYAPMRGVVSGGQHSSGTISARKTLQPTGPSVVLPHLPSGSSLTTATASPKVPVATPVVPKSHLASRSRTTSQQAPSTILTQFDASTTPSSGHQQVSAVSQASGQMGGHPNPITPIQASPGLAAAFLRKSSGNSNPPGFSAHTPHTPSPMSMPTSAAHPGSSPMAMGSAEPYGSYTPQPQPLPSMQRQVGMTDGMFATPMAYRGPPPGLCTMPMQNMSPISRPFSSTLSPPPGFAATPTNGFGTLDSMVGSSPMVDRVSHPHSRQASVNFENPSLGNLMTRPLPIGRPGSVVHSSPHRSQASEDIPLGRLGSSALLDDLDDDDQTDLIVARRRQQVSSLHEPFGSSLFMESPFKPSVATSASAAAAPWGSPSLFSQPKFPLSNDGWNNVPQPLGTSLPSMRSNHSLVPQLIRTHMCRICNEMAALGQSTPDGYVESAALLRRVRDIEPSMDESTLMVFCETEGTANNGGGTFDVRKDGQGPGRHLIRWDNGMLTGGSVLPSSGSLAYRAVGAPLEFQRSPVVGNTARSSG